MKLKIVLAMVILLVLYGQAASAAVNVVASNTIQNSSDSSILLIEQSGATSQKSLSLPINGSGTYRVYYESMCNGGSCLSPGYSYTWVSKNGVQITETFANVGDGTWHYNTYDITGSFNTTDIFELYTQTGYDYMNIRNFRLMYDITGYNISTSGNITTLERINWSSDTNSIFLGGAFNPQTINQFWANITSLSTRSDPYQINTSGLVGWWHFDDNLTDVSGQNNDATVADNGTLNNFAFDSNNGWVSTGKHGYGLKFNGTDGGSSSTQKYINTSDSIDGNIRLNISKGLTYLIWANLTDTTAYQSFGAKTNGGNPAPFDIWLGGGSNQIYFYIGNGTGNTFVSNSTAFIPNVWSYWGFTFNYTDKRLIIYKDAVVVANAIPDPSISVVDMDIPLLIGTRGDYYPQAKGTLDNPMLYNRVLTSTEINNIYSNPDTYPKDALLFYYDFNETSGTIAHDVQVPSYSSGKFNNATTLSEDQILHERILDSNPLKINTSITIDSWFKLNSISGYQEIIEKGDAGDNRDYIIRTNNNQLDFGYWNGTAWNIYTTTNANLTTNNWYYVTVSNIMGNGSSISFMLNGVLLLGTWSSGNGNSVNALSNNNIHIGRMYDNTERLNGQIDELRIYNRTKNLSEHQQDYATRLEQLQIGSNNIITTSYWNSSSDNSLDIPFYEYGISVSYVNLTALPSSISQNDIIIYDYNASSLFKINATISGIADSDAYIREFDLDNGAWLNITIPTGASDIVLYNSTDSPSSTVEMHVNQSRFRFSATTNQTITALRYTNDYFNFTSVGLDGYLNYSVVMKNGGQNFTLYSNSTIVSEQRSDAYNVVSYNHSVLDGVMYNHSGIYTHTRYNAYHNNTIDYPTGSPSILYENNTYYLFFSRYDNNATLNTGGDQLYMTTSIDGLTNWSEPVMVATYATENNESGENGAIADPDIVKTTDGVYHLYYTATSWNETQLPGNWNNKLYQVTTTNISNTSSWVHRGALNISGLPEEIYDLADYGFSDSASFIDSDGTIKLYFWGSYYDSVELIEGTDGINFTYYGRVYNNNWSQFNPHPDVRRYNNKYILFIDDTSWTQVGYRISNTPYNFELDTTHWFFFKGMPGTSDDYDIGTATLETETGKLYYAADSYYDMVSNNTCSGRYFVLCNSSIFAVSLDLEYIAMPTPRIITNNPSNSVVVYSEYENTSFWFSANFSQAMDNITWTINNTQYQDTIGIGGQLYSDQFQRQSTIAGSYVVNVTGINVNGNVSMSWEWVVNNTVPPMSITNNQTATGNFYINNTWADPTDPDYDHVYFAYANDTSLENVTAGSQYLNKTYSAHYTQNISAQSVDTSGNMNATKVWFNATITNNAPAQNQINETLTITEGSLLWINLTSTDMDNDSLTYDSNRSDLFTKDAGYNFSWQTTIGDAGTYNVNFNTTDSPYNGQDNETVVITINSSQYTPSTPISLSNTTGNFWVNYTWLPGIGNTTNFYNISQNSTWTNSSVPAFKNTTLLPHGWSNISVYAFNSSSTGTLNLTPVSANIQISNNAPTITSVGNKNVDEGQYLNFTISVTDLDSDTITYSTNATHGYLNSTGFFSWLSNYTDSGTYYWSYNVSDSYGGFATETITVIVSNIPQTFMPPTPINLANTKGNFWSNYTWSVGVGNVTDSYNVSITNNSMQTWINGSNQTLFNSTNLSARWWSNITVYAFNNSEGGTLNQTGTSSTTQMNSTPWMISWSNTKTNNNTLSFQVNTTDSVTFNGTSNQTITTWNWTRNDYVESNNFDNYTHQFLISNGTVNISLIGSNINGSTQYINWSVYVYDNGTYIPPVVSPSFVPYENESYGFSTITANQFDHLNYSDRFTRRWNESQTLQNQYIRYYINSSSLLQPSGTFSLTTNAMYNGNPSHSIAVTIYNFTSSSYDTLTNATYRYDTSTSFAFRNWSGLSNSHYRNSTGITIIGFNHSIAGISSHKFYIDEVKVTFGITPSFIPPIPTMVSSITSNFYVNQSWQAGSGNITNTYNVSVNSNWYNGTTVGYNNTTLSPHGWSNISVYAYNTSDGGTLNLTPLINNTRIPNNDPILTSIGSKSATVGDWLNFTISATDIDSDTLTNQTNATKGTLSGNQYSWLTDTVGIYYWSFNTSDIYGGIDSEIITVTISSTPTYIPPIPTNIASTCGNFWCNTTWSSGSGNVTNLFNISMNSTWTNNTLVYFINTTLLPHGTQNVSVYAFNTSGAGTLNVTAATKNSQVSNNLPVQTAIGNKAVDETQSLSFQIITTDQDSDSITYTTNATHGYLDTTGYFTWTTNLTDSGTYRWSFTSTDTYSGSDTETITVTVSNSALNISSSSPSSDPSTNEGTSQTFNINTNHTSTITWYIDSNLVQTNSSVTTASYSNSTSGASVYNITVYASDTIEVKSRMWNWTVITPPMYDYMPPTPTTIANTTGNFWVRHTWSAGNDNITNSYNVSVNSTWTNGTTSTFYNNTNVGSHGWSNISVYAFNTSGNGTINLTPLSQNTIVPNNAPTITSIGNKVQDENQFLNFTVSSSDTDSDTITNTTNATHGAFNPSTNTFSWKPNFTDSGTYYWSFNTTDSYNSLTTETVTVTINNVPLTLAYLPSSNPTTQNGTQQHFNITSNRSTTASWYYNTSLSQSNTTSTVFNYNNITLTEVIGTHNITVDATDGIDIATRTWSWTVQQTSSPSPTPTPAPVTVSGGGGGGGDTRYNEAMNKIIGSYNPPSLNITGSGNNWNIKIMNEGIDGQEYIINWVLRTQSGAVIDSGVLSKKVLPNEIYTVPLTFMGLFPGEYAIKVVAQYGIYQSEANQFFSIGTSYGTNEVIIALLVLCVIFLFTVYNRKVKK